MKHILSFKNFNLLPGILFIFPLLFALSSCSSQQKIISADESGSSYRDMFSDPKREAMDHFITGSALEAKGDYAAAILEYQDALRLDTSSGIYYALAKNYFKLNKIPLALQHSQKAIEMMPENTDYLDLLADIFSSAYQNDSAAVVLEKIISLDSSRISAYYQLALIYENTKPLQARELYNKIIEMAGPEWNVLLRLAELNEQIGNTDEAADNLQELIHLDPANESLQKLLADFYTRNKKYDKALEILNEIIEFNPDDLDAREKKAQVFIQQGKWSEASKQYAYILDQPGIPLEIKIRIGASYFSQALKDSTLLPIAKDFFTKMDKDTTDWQIKIYLGAIALTEGDDSTAIENFSIVTSLASWNSDAWVRLGGLYFDNARYDEAEKVLKEAVQSFPDNFAINLILGLSLSQNQKNAEAKNYLKKAVDLNGTDITALSAYGFVLNQLKENEEAIIYLKRALEIQPDDVNLLGTLGLIYDAMEMWNECDSVYEKALTIDSMNALVNNNYAYSLSERGIQLDRALSMVKIAVEKDSLNSSYLDTIGWVYFKLGNYEKAKEYIQKAIDAGGDSAVMHEHLGDIFYMLNEKNEAMKHWQKSFEIDSSNDKLKLKIEKGEL